MARQDTRSPVTEAVFNGFNALSNGLVRHDQDAHALQVRGGRLPFEATDLVTVKLIEAEMGLTALTAVVELAVYSDFADFGTDRPRLFYTGGPCPVDGVTALLGEGYLGFNADWLDGGVNAPRLGQLLLARGRDMRPAVTEGIWLATRDAQPRTTPLLTGPEIVVERGALVDTDTGPRFADGLHSGDRVMTVEDGLVPIRQVDRTTIPEGQAIRIRPGVVGNLRELLVDPDQPLLVTGATALAASGVAEALIPAHHLIDGDRVRAEWLPARQAVTLSFDRALTLYVEGAGVGSCDDLSAVIGTDRQRVSRAS